MEEIEGGGGGGGKGFGFLAMRAEGPLGKWVWSPEKRERWVTEGKMVLSILGYLIRKQTCPLSRCMFLQDVAFRSSSEADVVTGCRNIRLSPPIGSSLFLEAKP